MEKWEIEHIRNNLTRLLDTTMCDSSLIANLIERKVLNYPDKEELNSHSNSYDKCFSLYRIIQTRKNGYAGMIEALNMTGQNGALAILKDGLTNHGAEVSRLPIDHIPASTEQRWELFLQDHQAHYFIPDAAKGTIDVLTHTFYIDEMRHQLKGHKYYSPHILSSLHERVYDIMLKVYAQKAKTFKIEPKQLKEILSQSFMQFRTNHNLSLNGNLNFKESPAIGIDLGTCNLCVAVCLQGKMKIFLNSLGEKTTPSYVSFGEKGKMTIGKMARKYAYRNPTFTIFDSKRLIGRTFDDVEVKEDRPHWPFMVNDVDNIPIIVTRENGYMAEHISTLLLTECKAQAEKDLGQPVTKAVITVPAYFNNSQREATKRAGICAGLTVLQILNEPTAAAITYRQERHYDTAKMVLIFDMGGGTFDVAVVYICGEKIETIGIDGHTHLGGVDFDRRIMEYCIQEFKRTSGIDLRKWRSEKDISRNLANLHLACEEAKKDSSSTDEVEISVASVSIDSNLEVKLDRKTFEDLCMPLFEKVLSIVSRLLRKCEIHKQQVEDVILVGGSSRIPKLQEMLKEYFGGKELNSSINQDHAVAYGAAVQAAILNGEKIKKHLNIEKIVDAIPMSIGIQCIKHGVPGQFSRIIHKNSKYPNTYMEKYYTYQDNQEAVSISVYQGEQEIAAENFFIGTFRFEGIPKAPKGREEIDVIMDIDEMGILKVSAKCRGRTGKNVLTTTLTESSGLQYHVDRRGSSFKLIGEKASHSDK